MSGRRHGAADGHAVDGTAGKGDGIGVLGRQGPQLAEADVEMRRPVEELLRLKIGPPPGPARTRSVISNCVTGSQDAFGVRSVIAVSNTTCD